MTVYVDSRPRVNTRLVHYKKGPSNVSDMGPWAHTLVLLGKSLAINEVSKGDCIIMGDFNHGNIKWDTLQSTGVDRRRQQVSVPGTGQFPNSTCI